MNLNLTDQEVNQLLLFLNRAQISWQEATTLALLQQKIGQQLQQSQQVIQKVAENVGKEPKDKNEKEK